MHRGPFRIWETQLSRGAKHPEYYGKDFKGEHIYNVSGSLKNDRKILKVIKLLNIPTKNLFTKFNEKQIEETYNHIEDEFTRKTVKGEDPGRVLWIFHSRGS